MNDQERKAMEMALEALKDMNCGWKYIRESHGDLYGVGWDRAQGKADDAIEALRQALAQPEQKPVAYMGTDIDGNPNKFRLNHFGGAIGLYTKEQL